MKREIQTRVTEAARYILRTGATVRACAEAFGVSKTTIHKDMRERLPALDPRDGAARGRVLGKNRAERHIRGGRATREKYVQMKAARVRSPARGEWRLIFSPFCDMIGRNPKGAQRRLEYVPQTVCHGDGGAADADRDGPRWPIPSRS